MATETQQVVQNSSAVASNQAAGSTGASGGTAGSNTTQGSTSGVTPTPTAVVAPKGFRTELQEMLQGWQTAIPSDSTMQSSDGPLAQGAVVEQLQGYLGVYPTLDAQVMALAQTRAQEKAQLPEARRFFDVLTASVTNYFGKGSPQLAQFGLQPRKPRKALTSSQLAIKAAKSNVTRELRGTKGKKAKAPLKAGTTQFVVSVQEAAQRFGADGNGGGQHGAGRRGRLRSDGAVQCRRRDPKLIPPPLFLRNVPRTSSPARLLTDALNARQIGRAHSSVSTAPNRAHAVVVAEGRPRYASDR
jgi:hypothetical protein